MLPLLRSVYGGQARMIERDPEAPRDLGEISIAAELRRLLIELRRRQRIEGPAELDADQLHAVETAVGYRFADDLLATYAAGVPHLAARYALTLGRVVAHTGALAAAGARGDLIGLGHRDRDFLCLEKRTAVPTETTLLHYRDGRESETTSLTAWLADVLDEVESSGADPAPFEPQLRRAPPTGSSGRRVRHVTFGEGRVYLEIGTGPERKVKVDFPGAGLKLLQARFLEFLDES